MGNGTTMISRRRVLAAGVALPLVMARKARAQAATIKIGVLNDMSGPYRDLSGPVSVACVRQAIEDFGASGKGLNVQVVVGDHQNKPDVGSSIAREWIDREGVDFICDTANSTVALAVSGVVREKNKVYINSTAATAELTGKQCSPNTIHWTYDTWMLSRSTGGAMVKTGGDTWFFSQPTTPLGMRWRMKLRTLSAPRVGAWSAKCVIH
jgi:branched-chain amino acid transport system substrate-binding protein